METVSSQKKCNAKWIILTISVIIVSLISFIIYFYDSTNHVFDYLNGNYINHNYSTTRISQPSPSKNKTIKDNEYSALFSLCNFSDIDINGNTKNENIDLSIIIGTRNDNYGNNPLFRFALILKQLLYFQWYKKYNLYIEIIIVEWNVVETNKHIWNEDIIKNIILQNNYNSNILLKFIPVPHIYCRDRYDQQTYCPYYEYRAKNVGLRRSNGKWKLITNIDDLYSIRLLNHIAFSISNKKLDKNGIYQCQRMEIDLVISSKNLDLHDPYLLNKIDINNISNNLIKIRGHNNYLVYDENVLIEIPNMDNNNKYNKLCSPSKLNRQRPSGGDFNLFYYTILNKYGGGYLETESNRHLDTEFLTRQIFLNKYISYQFGGDCSYVHIKHDYDRRGANHTYIQWDLDTVYNINHKYKKLYNYTSFDCQKVKRIIQLRTAHEKQKKIPNETWFGLNNFWRDYVYPTSNKTWGLNRIKLSEYQCYW